MRVRTSISGMLQQYSLFAETRRLPHDLSTRLLRWFDTQYLKTAGIEAGDVLHGVLHLPTHFHDDTLVQIFAHITPFCPVLKEASALPGGGALPPLLRLVSPSDRAFVCALCICALR